MKFILKLIGSLFVIILLAVVTILVVIDPNDYKKEIQDIVKQNTGRTLEINGNIGLSFFPWVGLELNKTSLSNAQGFKEKHMAKINKIDIRLKVMPLIKKEINVAKIVLHGLTANLKIKSDGVSNWSDLTKSKVTTKKEVTQQLKAPKKTTSEQKAPLPSLILGGVELTDANISYVDLTSKTQINLKDFNLVIGRFELGKPFDMKMDFSIVNKEPAVSAKVAFGGKYTLDIANQYYQINKMSLNVETKGDIVPGGIQTASLDANATINLNSDIVNLENMKLAIANVTLNGQAKITQVTDKPQINGNLSIKKFNLRKTMAMLKMTPPEMADNQTLTEISANLKLNANLEKVEIKDLSLQLDQTHLTGILSVKDFSKPAIRYNLVLSEIDIDRYLPPKKEAPKKNQPQAKQEQDILIKLPVELIKALDVKGHFTAKGFKVMNLKTQQTDIGLLAQKGVININPLTTNLYQGVLDAKVKLDVNTKKPSYSVITRLNAVQVEPLMNDFMKQDKVQGKAQANIDIRTTGSSINALKAALNGKLNLAFKDGAIKGLNLAREIRKADAVINGKKFDESRQDPKTDFSDATMSAIIRDGVLTNNDLSLKAPLLRVAGKGKVNLINNTIDYLVNAELTDKLEGQSGEGVSNVAGMSIPVRIFGPFDDINVDVQLGDAIKARAKAELEASLEAKKKELDASLEAKKKELDAIKKAKRQELEKQKEKIKAELKAKQEAKKRELQKKIDAEKKKQEEKLKKQLFNGLGL